MGDGGDGMGLMGCDVGVGDIWLVKYGVSRIATDEDICIFIYMYIYSSLVLDTNQYMIRVI